MVADEVVATSGWHISIHSSVPLVAVKLQTSSSPWLSSIELDMKSCVSYKCELGGTGPLNKGECSWCAFTKE